MTGFPMAFQQKGHDHPLLKQNILEKKLLRKRSVEGLPSPPTCVKKHAAETNNTQATTLFDKIDGQHVTRGHTHKYIDICIYTYGGLSK